MNMRRDISRAEMVEAEIDAMIRRRDAQRRETEGERREGEFGAESEARHAQQRREANRSAWREYHRAAAERARRTMERLVAEHESAAERLSRESA